ncbi:GNAT family N-acetyltransferase [Novosphingobium sp. PS1R-30]|uniref:GNAT family N-acetyltransferase n=1 Tax=Novosphingobium anseongense TaxID=3133436 RepID=A0ABU8RXV5_9SPHN
MQTTMSRAEARDADAMVRSFCEAFADDPGLAWIWPDRADRIARLPFFFEPIVGGTMLQGLALRSEASDAVSLWRQPGRIHPEPHEMAPWHTAMARAFSAGAERSQLMGATLRAHQPADFDWWYLQFIGVRPAAQGTGLGGAIVRSGLALAQAAGMPVYVEVMNPDNFGYYRHVGFQVIDEFDIPDGGPHVWGMLWGQP